jgi:hypothetical protein
MAKKMTASKTVSAKTGETKEVIQLLSVDYGREDLNTMARKINEIIVKMNG